MRRTNLLLLAAALVACRGGSTIAPPVLTLLPPAFEGGTLTQGERCLRDGEAAGATVYVHAGSVTFTVRGRGSGEAALDVALGAEHLARTSMPLPGTAVELTYRARPPRGEQRLRLTVAGEGEVCITDVALTQP